MLICVLGLLTTGYGPPGTPVLEVFPKHFLLHPGGQIHYTVLERFKDNLGGRYLGPG
jgi:hypothetical protein